MDGKGRCLDNVFVERLWRSLTYEAVFLHAYEGPRPAKNGIGSYFVFFMRSARTKRWATGRRWRCIESPSAARERPLDGICCTS
jgi:hypothetical protein